MDYGQGKSPGIWASTHSKKYAFQHQTHSTFTPEELLGYELILQHKDSQHGKARTGKTLAKVNSETKPGLLVETSRGCWWKKTEGCTFCGLNGEGTQYRLKPVEAVLNELQALKDRYGINRFEIVDKCFQSSFTQNTDTQINGNWRAV
jgi:radical SAM superfamily enzyme YgiQ (UPF0313 family)